MAVKDDRGRTIDPARTRAIKRLEGRDGYPRAGTCSRIDFAVRHSSDETPYSLRRLLGTLGRTVITIAIFYAVIFLSWRVVSLMGGGGFQRLMVLVAAVVVAMLFNAYRRQRAFGQLIATTLTAEGICGSCGYSLRGLTREGDGCVVCPECGAAWREVRFAEMPAEPPPVHCRLWNYHPMRTGANPHVLPDDRGRLVEFLDPTLRRLTRERRAALGPAARPIVRELRAIGRRARLVTTALLLGTAAFIAVFMVWDVRAGEHADHVPAWCGVGFIVLIALFMPFTDSFANPLAIKDRLLTLGRCASCAERLDDKVSEDGCTVCGLCGAAWRRPPPASPA